MDLLRWQQICHVGLKSFKETRVADLRKKWQRQREEVRTAANLVTTLHGCHTWLFWWACWHTYHINKWSVNKASCIAGTYGLAQTQSGSFAASWGWSACSGDHPCSGISTVVEPLHWSPPPPLPTPPKEATPVIEDLLPSKNKKNSLLLRDISCKWATKTRNHPDLF